jgi:hypothetical protein
MTDSQTIEPIVQPLPHITPLRLLAPKGAPTVTSTIALRLIRCPQGSVFQGTVKARAEAVSPNLTAPKRNEPWHRVDRKTRIFQTYTRPTAASPWHNLHCRQSRSLPSARVTSRVNGVLKRNVVSPQWDSHARPAKRQHHRCIGCEKKTLLHFSILGLHVGRFEKVRRSPILLRIVSERCACSETKRQWSK